MARVLCLGDSNTYGLAVRREESYPNRLEKLWEEQQDGSRIDVINLGFPGTNSSQVLRDFDRNIDLLHPDVVVVSIGSNDFWTMPVPTSATPQPLLARMRRWSRLYKLLYMATRNGNAEAEIVITDPDLHHGRGKMEYEGEVFELGHDRADWDPETGRRLVRNLLQLVVRANKRGVRLVLLNYASQTGFYPAASRKIESVAARTGTPFVDVNVEFRTVCPKEPCPEWIFPKGHLAFAHPTARGYELVAKTVLAELSKLL
jgi:lysophospholipase L1-like esterase